MKTFWETYFPNFPGAGIDSSSHTVNMCNHLINKRARITVRSRDYIDLIDYKINKDMEDPDLDTILATEDLD